MRRWLFVAVSIFTFNTGAEDFEAYKRSFDPLLGVANERFDRADQLREKLIPLDKEITRSECEDLKLKILVNYPLNPFSASYGDGNYGSSFCLPEDKDKKAYFQKSSGTNNFGIAYTSVYKTVSKYSTSQFLINDQNVIVEIFSKIAKPGKWTDTDIASLASLETGDYYYLRLAVTDGVDTVKTLSFVAGDGSTPEGWTKDIAVLNAEPSAVYTSIRLSRPFQTNWEAVFNPLTMGWSPLTLYKHDGKFYSSGYSLGSDELFLKYKDKTDICAHGFQYRTTPQKPLPSKESAYRCASQQPYTYVP